MAALVAGAAFLLVRPVLHEEFQVAHCKAGATKFLVEVVGTYMPGAMDRRSPYDVRLVQPSHEAGLAIEEWRGITFSAVKARVFAAEGGRAVTVDSKEGPSSRALIMRGVSLPFVDLDFGADVHFGDGRVIYSQCQLIAEPMREWRMPLFDRLLSV